MMNGFLLAFFLVVAFARTPALAHDLNRTVTRDTAVIIELTYPDKSPFSFESYEIFRENEETPFQVGRTDGRGRIVFIPDHSGAWRVRAFSEDGHGLDFTVEAGAERLDVESSGPAPGRLSKTIMGVAVLFGVFGIVSLFYRRRPA
ncbi:MAG: hypothetical protein HY770_00855 [Chitinivibrionia bacterium]|nr:hypothetical protein [Chitinivibrionia bacterium]